MEGFTDARRHGTCQSGTDWFDRLCTNDVHRQSDRSELANEWFGIITVLWFVGSLNDSVALAAVFGTLALTYGLIGLGYWLDFGALNIWGGYFAMVTALLAAYVAFAKVTN